MKYLLLLVVGAVLWWVWSKRREASPPAVAPERPVMRMVSCAHCGVHFPENDALTDGDQRYCCEAHRQAAAGGGN